MGISLDHVHTHASHSFTHTLHISYLNPGNFTLNLSHSHPPPSHSTVQKGFLLIGSSTIHVEILLVKQVAPKATDVEPPSLISLFLGETPQYLPHNYQLTKYYVLVVIMSH